MQADLSGRHDSLRRRLRLLQSTVLHRHFPAMPHLTVLTYHRVLPNKKLEDIYSSPHIIVTPETLARQMEALRSHYTLLTASEVAEHMNRHDPFPGPCALVTFDDGWADNYTYALPILRKYRIPALILLTTDFIEGRMIFWPENMHFLLTQCAQHKHGREILSRCMTTLEALPPRERKMFLCAPPLEAVERLKKVSPPLRSLFMNTLAAALGNPSFPVATHAPLTQSQVQKMRNAGISFGSHGCRHRILTQCTPEEMQEEINGSHFSLKQLLQQDVHAFAYPNGNYNQSAQRMLREIGVQIAFTTEEGVNTIENDPMALLRINISESRCMNTRGRFSLPLLRMLLSK
jgi:peptidoglycan/xylan/chitin deacetylase (PgdA/CDA1 family)